MVWHVTGTEIIWRKTDSFQVVKVMRVMKKFDANLAIVDDHFAREA